MGSAHTTRRDEALKDADKQFVLARDADGNLIANTYVSSAGRTVDADHALRDSDGNPISALDPNGDPIPGVYVLATTLDRNLALERNGDPYYSARLTYDRRQARVEPLRVSS